jgi:hypothetical protein
MNKEMDRILLVGCPEKKIAGLSSLAAVQDLAPMFVKSVNVAIRMVDESVRADEKFQKVITVSHIWEKEDGEDNPRLGSELAKKCSEAGIPCIVFANITGGTSIIQEFLKAAKRAGATRILKTINWEQAITCQC